VDCRNAFKYLCRCESKNCARESTAKAGAKRLEPLRYPVFDTSHNRQSHKFISTASTHWTIARPKLWRSGQWWVWKLPLRKVLLESWFKRVFRIL
jgi:hypothetical protein